MCLQDDFLALELVNARVRLSWSTGAEATFFVHPESIEYLPRVTDAAERWYEVVARRYALQRFLLVLFVLRATG